MTQTLRWVLTLTAAFATGSVAWMLSESALLCGAAALLGATGALWLFHLGATRPLQQARQSSESLRKQQQLLQAFMDNAPLVMALKDAQGRYLAVNPAFERKHGVAAEELMGKIDTEFMETEAAQAVRENDQSVMRSGKCMTYTVPMHNPSGLRQLEVVKFALQGADGAAVGVGLVGFDVTEREASFEKFERVFHGSPSWIIISRLSDGLVIDANEGFELLSGYTRSAVIGHSIADVNIWVHPQQRVDIVQNLLRDRRVIDARTQIRRKDGEIRDCSTNAALITLGGEADTHAVWIVRDVTDEQASHEQFVTAFRLSPDYMSISRLSDGRYVDVNAAFERFTGVARAQAIGKTSTEIGLWTEAGQRRAMAEALMRYGELRDIPISLRNAQGDARQCLGSASLFETRGAQYMIAMVRDVTEARQAENALLESEARFSKLFELSPVPLSYSFDTDDYATSHRNAAFYTCFGLERVSAGTRSADILGLWVRPEDAALARQVRLAARPVDNWVVPMRRADGELLEIAIYGRIIVEPHRTIMVTTLLDITQQRRAQQNIESLNTSLEDRVRERTHQLEATNGELSQALRTLEQARDSLVQSEKLASLGSLVAGIAHELNTPIGNGLMVASALEDRVREFALAAKQPMQRAALEHFLSEAGFAADLLTRSLTRSAALVSSFKQVAVDQASSQRRSFDLSHLLEEAVMTLSPTIRRSHCEVLSQVPPGLWFDSYPGALVQVLTNLIHNAVVHGFTPGQAGRITVSARALPPSEIEIIVADEGQGIPAANLKRIFDPFFTTRLGQGGSGLGLHVVHNIVNGVLGGRIDVDTEIGRGTRFILQLPAYAPRVIGDDSIS